MTHRRALALLLALSALVVPSVVSAQSISISSPTAGQRIAAGPDFATGAIGDPWDMNNREDYTPAENPFEIFGFASDLQLDGAGRLIGTVTNGDAQVFVLHRGFYGAINPGRNGTAFPIDPSQYRKLAVKIYSDQAGRIPGIYWYQNGHDSPGGDILGLQHNTAEATVSGSKIFVYDLAAPPTSGTPWTSATVRGLRIDFNQEGGGIGTRMGLDWVRLIPADGHASSVSHTIVWSGPSSGTYTLTVEELGPNPAAPVTIASVSASGSGTNSFAWKYGFLPPGSYRLKIARSGSTTRSVDFVINDPPVVHVTDPDETGGADFATLVLGNPWDMSDAADVAFTQNVVNASFSGGEFHGANTAGNFDPSVWLLKDSSILIDSSRYHRLTYKFRLDGAFDLSPAGGSMTRVFWGSTFNRPDLVAISEDIVNWPGNNTYTFDLSALRLGENNGIEPGSPALELWTSGAKRHFRIDPHEGTNQRTFHYDYVKIAADDEASGGQFTIAWRWTDGDGSPSVSLYYDTDTNPTSGLVTIATGLAAGGGGTGSFVWNTGTAVPPGLYYVYAVVSDGLNSQGRYSTGPVRVLSPGTPASQTLTVTVSGGGSVASSPGGIACGADCTESFAGGTQVTLVASPAGGSRFAGWSGDADCLDGQVSMTGSRSCTATFVTALPWGATRSAVDANGDSGGDSFRYKSVTGQWSFDFGNRLGGFSSLSGQWSTTGWSVQAADFDGNGVTDLFLYHPITGEWYKAINNGAGGLTYFGGTWSPGWRVFILDLDANGRSDVFLYDDGTGMWFRCTSVGSGTGGFAYASGLWSSGWGILPAEFNADGRADLFLYHQGSGQWFRAINDGANGFTFQSGFWSPGWTIHSGDFNGDGVTDLFLYSNATGQWFVAMTTGSGFTYTGQVWSSGWTIHPADFDGNGRTDLFVYSQVSGQWFECVSNGIGGFSYFGGSWSPGWEIYPTDFNVDRRSDLLLYAPGTGLYFQAITTGNGTFQYTSGNWGAGWTIVATRTALP